MSILFILIVKKIDTINPIIKTMRTKKLGIIKPKVKS